MAAIRGRGSRLARISGTSQYSLRPGARRPASAARSHASTATARASLYFLSALYCSALPPRCIFLHICLWPRRQWSCWHVESQYLTLGLLDERIEDCGPNRNCFAAVKRERNASKPPLEEFLSRFLGT